MTNPRVFISYSQESPEHAERVRRLGASLSRDGCVCLIDVHKDTGEDWPTWMTRQLTESDFVLCVVTQTYEHRFRDKELPDQGLGVGWEATLIRRLLYAKKLHNDRIFPVLFAKSDRDHIPVELQSYDYFLLDGQPGYVALLRKLLKQPLHIPPITGAAPVLPSTQAAPLFDRPSDTAAPQAASSIPADISRILKYAPADLIGRDSETALLNDAWSKVQSHAPGRPHVLTFVALGGEGKTALIAKWAASLAGQDWPGCDAAFAWSFYSQGTRDQQTASSDLFLREALIFFGDPETAASAEPAYEKGKRLARLIGEKRALLILDGVEPLQYPPTPPHDGRLKDDGLAALLKGLASSSRGLCVVTTRHPFLDLKAFRQTTAPEVPLLRLSREAGVHLLKTLGVHGAAQEFAKLVEDVKGHALTLTILGGFLNRAFHGDIRQRDRVKFETADEKIDGGHAFRAIAAYEQWLLSGGDEGRREVAVLRLMGLFDRPADAGCLTALRREPISDLTEPLAGLPDEDWEFCLTGLESARLLTVNRDIAGALLSLDAHPLLREYFARQLRDHHPAAWRAGHRRLYEHLTTTTPPRPDTLVGLQPLYQAVAHGCMAGLHQKACDDVYFARILRGTGADGAYSTKKLGAISADLGAVASFFQTPWKTLSPNLSPAGQSWLLNEAAYSLHALGRLTEAVEPMRAGLQMDIATKAWKNAAISAGNLSELELTRGAIPEAVDAARESVKYADLSGDESQRVVARTTLADALHQAGRSDEAQQFFVEAEALQARMQPEYPRLYSLQGFRYCDLLLSAAERAAWASGNPAKPEHTQTCAAVIERATQTLAWAEPHEFLLDIALDHLTLVRAALFRERLASAGAGVPQSGIVNTQSPIRVHLDAAVNGLRAAGDVEFIVRGLLTRSWLRFLTGDPTGSREDLDEAWDIAERGPMPLHQTDILLHRARLFCRTQPYPWPGRSARMDLAAARDLITEHGYHRRDGELADAEEAARTWPE